MRTWAIGLAGAALLLVCHATALADEPGAGDDLSRQQLERVLAVLRAQPTAAGPSCLESLRDMHKTEDQVKALQARAKDPDKALAQDVLESDYENSREICGADAARLCYAPSASAGMTTACAGLRHARRNQ
ncbi:hypothetical protein [Lichenicoccus roseus]|uniref:DUF1311 domain-containing protein n=1 Tax=Lichenicoccus roseus TaxID=2683649 RepID=A0A5R9J4Z7_9PROT|nr:hypothetical protein [Lichenicoccus roseus]TLU72694.1 hypothetical protein FE263_11720 [Lichenicoccus roseus]